MDILEGEKEVILITHDESAPYSNEGAKIFWMENEKKKLLPKSRGTSTMVSGFMCACHGFMCAEFDGVSVKYHQLFEAGKAREGWFTNEDLNLQFKACHHLFRCIHPLNDCELWFDVDHSMTHKAEAPDGLDASKLNKSDGGANVPKMRGSYYDAVVNGVTNHVI